MYLYIIYIYIYVYIHICTYIYIYKYIYITISELSRTLNISFDLFSCVNFCIEIAVQFSDLF